MEFDAPPGQTAAQVAATVAAAVAGLQTAAQVTTAIDTARPQAVAALTVSGSGDALTAAPTWSTATILTASPAGNIAINVAGCPDGASRWLYLTPANTKTATFSATGGTIRKLGGADTNPITGTGTAISVVMVARIGTVYALTITTLGTFT